jgi:hypothetical protein
MAARARRKTETTETLDMKAQCAARAMVFILLGLMPGCSARRSRTAAGPPASVVVTPGALRLRLSAAVCTATTRLGDTFTGTVGRTRFLFGENALPQELPDTTFPTGLVAVVEVASITRAPNASLELAIRSLRKDRLHADGLNLGLTTDHEQWEHTSAAGETCYPKGAPLIGSINNALELRP